MTLTALLAVHALRVGEIRRLTLTDVRDLDRARLYLPGRPVLLAPPVLAAYLAHRHQRSSTWSAMPASVPSYPIDCANIRFGSRRSTVALVLQRCLP